MLSGASASAVSVSVGFSLRHRRWSRSPASSPASCEVKGPRKCSSSSAHFSTAPAYSPRPPAPTRLTPAPQDDDASFHGAFRAADLSALTSRHRRRRHRRRRAPPVHDKPPAKPQKQKDCREAIDDREHEDHIANPDRSAIRNNRDPAEQPGGGLRAPAGARRRRLPSKSSATPNDVTSIRVRAC